MALKGLVSKLQGKLQDTLGQTLSKKSDRGPWRPEAGPYPMLSALTENDLQVLEDKSGVFALWHRGVRPQWIFAGYAADLAAALLRARGDEDIQKYMLNDGVYVAWTFLTEEEAAGVVQYLRLHMQPALTAGALVEVWHFPAEAQPVEFPIPID